MMENFSVICIISSFLLLQTGLAFKLARGLGKETNSVDGSDLYFAKGSVAPDDVVTQLGGHLVLYCEARGSPTPTIHWLFNGERIIQDGQNHISDDEAFYENNPHNKGMRTIRLGSTKSKLFIDCVTEANQGTYTCVADEPTQRIAKVTKVRVESSFNADQILLPSCLDKRHVEASTPARIIMWTSHRLEVEGADVQLFCRTAGNPAPKIMWYYVDDDENEVPLTSDQFKILDNGDLFVTDISFLNNMGTYRCVAENASGRDEEDAFLYPTGIGK